MALEIVGREDELASVRGFVDATRDAHAALVLEGEAGIGKSTIWLAGVENARGQGFRVLVSRPAEAECNLAYVGLGDLLTGVLGDVVPRLAPPRRRALEIALLLEDAADHDRVDRRAVAVAVHDALQLLGERAPLLIAIDDVQWLDDPSGRALAFALRRLASIRVLVLAARRGSAEQTELEQALADGPVTRVSVGPLSAGAIHRLLHDRLGRSFPRQTLLRIHERSGGNPFFALELARVVGVDADPLEPLPVPATLDELLRVRLAGLPAATRDALALASALGTPSESLLERAGIVADVLEPARVAHVIERDNGTVRFTHPLLSSVVYNDLGEKRRDVHRRIVEIVDDPLLRARHLALSSETPDPEIAAVLDEASTLAAERGASAVGAELAEHALRLTPRNAVDEHNRRALAAAQAHRAAGEWTRAGTIVSDLLQEHGLGTLRAEALILLADLEVLDRTVPLLEEALAEAESQPALQATIQCRLAWAVRHTQGFVKGLEHARTALELADEVDDDALRIEALAMLTFLGTAVGDVDVLAHAARARELATALGDAELLKRATWAVAQILDAHRDVNAARALLEREYDEWHARDETWTASVLGELSWIELYGGRWEMAAGHAAHALEISLQYGRDVPWVHVPVSVIAAHRGELDIARLHSERSLRLAEQQFGTHTPVHLGTLGFVALQSGEPHRAVDWFEEAAETTARYGWGDPSQRWWVADHVEALLELGRVDDAGRILDAWEADARRLERPWVLAHATRCRGLVAAAQGAVDEAASLLEQATEDHERVGDRFGRARALLALGAVRRRQRRKRTSRDAIEAALAEFEELGAATWVEKARSELGRIGGRTRTEGLTPAEQRVAGLVAEGRTNREVAAALFLTEHTVETHLSHVYAKLGVRSRAELARTFRADEQNSGGLPISS